MQDCNNYILSIIIPMYNAASYIGNCLDSIFSSGLTDKECEIVVVNDGSKDQSPDIVAQYVRSHLNVSYFTQENQGQSTARNYGVRMAKGEYIWFVDADDVVNEQAAKIIPFLRQHTSLDVLAVRLRDVKEDGSIIGDSCTQPTLPNNIVMKGRDAVLSGYNPSSVCALITRKSLLINQNLSFVPGITHQDVELSYRIMCQAGDVIFVSLAPYLYIQHPNSTSKSVNPAKKIKYLSDDIYIIRSFSKLADALSTDKQLSDVIRHRVSNIHFGMVYNLYVNRKVWRPLGINKAVIANMRKAGLYPLSMRFGSWKKNLFTLILNRSKWLG